MAKWDIDIKAIRFNHAVAETANTALNLRYNADTKISIPEYDAVAHSSSPIAYIADEVDENLKVEIKVCILKDGKRYFGDVGVRAKEKDISIMGNVDQQTIPCINGYLQGEYAFVSLPHNTINKVLIGKYKFIWQWTFTCTDDDSTKHEETIATEHMVYIIPHKPLGLWQVADPNQIFAPWAETMDFVCQEFSNTVQLPLTDEEIKKSVVRLVNESGMKYDIVQGACYYTQKNPQPRLYAKRLMEDIKNKKPGGMTVNCNDCACIVAFFLSILGIDMKLAYIASTTLPVFSCNAIQAIGYTDWKVPFGKGFTYHALCGEVTSVFDACLVLDGSEDPWAAPPESRVSLHPEGLVYTTGDPNPKPPFPTPTYKERLCAKDALPAVDQFQNKPLGPLQLMISRITAVDPDLFHPAIGALTQQMDEKELNQENTGFGKPDYSALNLQLKVKTQELSTDATIFEDILGEDLRIVYYCCQTPLQAQGQLDQLVKDCAALLTPLDPPQSAGDIAFAPQGDGTFSYLFCKNATVCWLQTRNKETELLPLALALAEQM